MKGLLSGAGGGTPAASSAAALSQPAVKQQQQQQPNNLSVAVQQETMKLQHLNNKKAELLQHLQQLDQSIQQKVSKVCQILLFPSINRLRLLSI
jgi:hypothetical protein